MSRRPFLTFTGGAWAVLGVAVLLFSGAATLAAPPSSTGHAATGRQTHFVTLSRPSSPVGVHPPSLGIGHTPGRTLAPLGFGDLYYTQEGMTIGQINGSSATGMKRISEYVKLVTSPYSTGYELNGLSASGDWWQIVIADNWPGCNAGFEEITEVWDNVQGSGPVNCNANLTFSSGDQVEFTLYFASGGDGCLKVEDISTVSTNLDCQTQPDSGGKTWQFLTSISDTNGYYTGPMTETINQTTSACPDYTVMPRLSYLYPNGTFVTAFTPWSDEFDLSAGTPCYASSLGEQGIGPGDPESYYVDTAAGTGLGPHWVDGQNYSMVNPAYGFRFQTDPVPMTYVGLNASTLTPTAGSTDNFTANVSGGVAPFSVLWSLNSVLQPGPVGLTWSWVAGLAGTYRVFAYVEDKDSGVGGPSAALTITVPGPLQVTAVSASPATGDDVGLPVTFNVTISGGFGYWAVTWSGLPTGCPSANASSIRCTPTQAGTTNVSVVVRDANGSLANSGPFRYQVFLGLSATVVANDSTIDVGESVTFVAVATGGSGGNLFSWSLPPGCTGRGASVACSPASSGELLAFVTVTDSAGSTVTPIASAVTVNPALVATWSRGSVLADAGAPVSVAVVVTGGTAPLSFTWPGLPSGCTSSGAVANCTIAAAGRVVLSTIVWDGAGESSDAGDVTVSVAAAPSVALATGGPNLTLGAPETFTATAAGGNAPFYYVWSGLPSGCGSADAAVLTCTPANAGTYTVTVAATDQVGVTVRGTATLTVTAPPGPSGGGGISSEDLAIGLA
ncbi:MAG TPA: hypothetical protein VGP88_07210, partial [Thermoplasmata archaeon]|nr:hypothetical protein [Thermoplasmata archaeon]